MNEGRWSIGSVTGHPVACLGKTLESLLVEKRGFLYHYVKRVIDPANEWSIAGAVLTQQQDHGIEIADESITIIGTKIRPFSGREA